MPTVASTEKTIEFVVSGCSSRISPPPGIAEDHLTISGIALDVHPDTTIRQMAMILSLGTLDIEYKEAPEDEGKAFFCQPLKTVPVENMTGVLYRAMTFSTRSTG